MTLVQLTLAGYRRTFIEGLKAHFGDGFRVGAGKDHLDPSMVLGVPPASVDVPLRNIYLFSRRIAYQVGWWKALRRSDVWVLELNPRVINTWCALVAGRLLRRRTVVWGHFRGRALGETGPRLARRAQVHLASGVLAYTDVEGEEFSARFPRTEVHVAPNAIDRADQLRPARPADGYRRDSFLYVGRLIPEKGIDALVEGFAHARAKELLPRDAKLVVVGDGPLREALHQRTRSLPADTVVSLLPASFDRAELDELYQGAVAGVCGGYVGLNLTQSLSRGVPFLYPTTSNHSPEVSLATPENSWAMVDLTADTVATTMRDAWQATASGTVDHQAIQRDTVSRYSIETMVAGFAQAVARRQ